MYVECNPVINIDVYGFGLFGAIVGGIVGGVIGGVVGGLATGGNPVGIIVGAIAGAGIGATVGHAIEESQKDSAPDVESEAISEEQAQQLFNDMAAQKDIAFKYPNDGCYARAHLMSERMQEQGITPGKVWNYASANFDPTNGTSLRVNTKYDYEDKGYVEWGYHVAPTVKVQRSDGTVEDMVIDPSLFDKPVTIAEWKAIQGDSSSVIMQTKLGEPAYPGIGGSGYWPGEDPSEGVDEHAKKTMEDYKKKEAEILKREGEL